MLQRHSEDLQLIVFLVLGRSLHLNVRQTRFLFAAAAATFDESRNLALPRGDPPLLEHFWRYLSGIPTSSRALSTKTWPWPVSGVRECPISGTFKHHQTASNGLIFLDPPRRVMSRRAVLKTKASPWSWCRASWKRRVLMWPYRTAKAVGERLEHGKNTGNHWEDHPKLELVGHWGYIWSYLIITRL